MAVVMATTYPELYAAAGVHSGLPYAVARDVPSAFAAMSGKPAKSFRKGRSDVSHSVPIIVFHGDNDTTVHPSNGDDVVAQVSPGSAPASAAVSGVEPTVEHGDANGRAYTRTTHFDAAGKPVIEQWLVHGAAHAWSGGSVEGSFSDPAGPDASREMVRFFLQHENTQ
jgi:poly(3-hydroxybutyrate) depolymerase